jgi:DNA uptake protein ComE-like DNA-binding protein
MAPTLKNRLRIASLGAVLSLALVALPAAAAKPAPSTPVNINTATQAQLEALPGVGAATAKKIIAGRPYARVEDLSRAGVSAKTLAQITPLVTVGNALAAGAAAAAVPAPAPAPAPAAAKGKAMPSTPVNINTATQSQLEALPGVGAATAKKIIAGRPYARVEDLSRAGVSAKTLAQITPLVTVGNAVAAAAAAAAVPAPAPAPAAKPAPTAAATTPQTPPSPGMVWVNTDTKVFHHEGDRWYGNTKHGKWMTEADAIKAGYHEAKKAAPPTKKKP